MYTYMISEAAKLINVEAHALRYWEEELGIIIARNEMGHRYYTEADIMLFKQIKTLKDEGMNLGALSKIVPELNKEKVEREIEIVDAESELNQVVESKHNKIEKFKSMMSEIITDAIIENNNRLSSEISEIVSYEVTKELNHTMKKHEANEEERYRKFDAVLREYQKSRMMTALANEGNRPRKKSKFFKKNKVTI